MGKGPSCAVGGSVTSAATVENSMEFLTKLKVELPCDPACSRERQPTPVFLPGDPTDTGAWRATVHAITKSGTRLSVSTHDPTGPSLHGKWIGKQWKQCQTLFFGAPKSLQMVMQP